MDIIKGLKGLKGSLPVHLVSSFYVLFAEQYMASTHTQFIIKPKHIKLHTTQHRRKKVFFYRNSKHSKHISYPY